MRPSLLAAVLFATLAGCATQSATVLPLPRELRTECEADCAKLDLRLAAVVVVRNSVGCVCSTEDAPRAGAVSAGGATAAGAAAIVADEEARAEEQRRREEDERSPSAAGVTP